MKKHIASRVESLIAVSQNAINHHTTTSKFQTLPLQTKTYIKRALNTLTSYLIGVARPMTSKTPIIFQDAVMANTIDELITLIHSVNDTLSKVIDKTTKKQPQLSHSLREVADAITKQWLLIQHNISDHLTPTIQFYDMLAQGEDGYQSGITPPKTSGLRSQNHHKFLFNKSKPNSKRHRNCRIHWTPKCND